jgi:hypothetical protein
MHQRFLTAMLGAASLLSTPQAALALDKIYSPSITAHELEVEYLGSRTFDDDGSVNNGQEHELELEYAPTNWLKLELAGEFEREPDENLDFSKIELESVFSFARKGENWIDSGLLLAYGFATRGGEPDEIEAKLLLEKDVGKWTHRANLGLEQEVGSNAGSGGPEFAVLWNSRYRYSSYFQPGIEIQSGLGNRHELGHFDAQEHYAGPAVYGSLMPHVKYEAAYLFGASKTAADGAARLLLEYETSF